MQCPIDMDTASPEETPAMTTQPSIVTWHPHLSLGVTGHRDGHPALAKSRAEIEEALGSIFSAIEEIISSLEIDTSPVRLHSLLASGVDQMSAHLALQRGWDLVAPLPFGAELNLAINADAQTPADASALVAGEPAADRDVEARAEAIRQLLSSAHVFEIADRDETIEESFQPENFLR